MKIGEKYGDANGTKFTVVDLEADTVYYTRQDNSSYVYSCLRPAFLERFTLIIGE